MPWFRLIAGRFAMDFKVRLRQVRLSRGLSQQVLASRLGLSKQAVSNYESGANTPTFQILLQLSRELGVTLDCLAGMDSGPTCADGTAADGAKDAAYLMGRLSPEGRSRAVAYIEALLEKEEQYGAK